VSDALQRVLDGGRVPRSEPSTQLPRRSTRARARVSPTSGSAPELARDTSRRLGVAHAISLEGTAQRIDCSGHGVDRVRSRGCVPVRSGDVLRPESSRRRQGNGQVDRVYPFHCYRDAIRSLPVDVVDYSNAKEDILRALAFARRGKPDPGPAGGLRPTADDPTETTETPHVPDEPGEAIASTLVDTSSASSVPVPLLILGGLSILLLAAGGASHLGRRYRTRREGSPPDPH